MCEFLSQFTKADYVFSRLIAGIEYDGQLSATAYIILSVVLLGIITGLGWCFYRVLSAANEDTGIQYPDEIGDEEQIRPES